MRFIKDLLAGNVVEGGAGGAYPGADGQPGKAYGPGAIAGRGGKGGRFGRGGDGGDATVIGKGRAIGGAGGDVVDVDDRPKLFFVKGSEDKNRARALRRAGEVLSDEVKGTIRFPEEPGVYTLTVNETGFYDVVLPAPKGRAEGGAQ